MCNSYFSAIKNIIKIKIAKLKINMNTIKNYIIISFLLLSRVSKLLKLHLLIKLNIKTNIGILHEKRIGKLILILAIGIYWAVSKEI